LYGSCLGRSQSSPATASRAAAASSTRRLIGPTWSMLCSEPNPTPKWDTSPNVGFSPTTPQLAAGWRIDPPWSPPKEMSTSPAASATAEPEDDPPDTRFGSCGLIG